MGSGAFLTFGTEPEKVEAMVCDPEPRFFSELLGEIVQPGDLRIDDLFASQADEVRVRIRPGAVISVPGIDKAELHDLAQIPQEGDRLVNGGETRDGKILFDPFINLLGAQVFLVLDQYLSDREPLGR